MKENQGAGRPVEIDDETVISTYNLTVTQKEWIKSIAKQRRCSASDIMRGIVDKEMKRGKKK